MTGNARRWFALWLVGGLFLCPVVAVPSASFAATKNVILKPDAGPFIPNANEFAAALVIVPRTHQMLYSFKPDLPWPAASLTKLANALVFFQHPPSLKKIVTLKTADEVGGGRLRVANGARLTVADLVFSSITASANNAATAMARITGLSTKTFLARMNVSAKKVGAVHSTFFDASGMNEKNRTTARDMALLAEAAFKLPLVQKAASTDVYSFLILNTGERKTIKSTNDLLTKDPDVYIVGGKTGYLEESKYNLVVQIRPMRADGAGDRSKELIIVVFGAPDKPGQFTAAKRLAEWAWENHEF